MLNYHDIAKIFEEIEIRLISSLKRNLGRHKNEEHQHGFKWSAWQTEKLRNINRFRQENSRIMNSYTNVIDSTTRQIMLDEFAQGMNGINAAVPENIPDTPAEIVREPHFFGVDKTKIDKLVEDVVTLEKHAETAVLRTMDDVYRQTVNKAQLAMSMGTPLQKAIDMAMKDFLDKGINCIVYRDGRRVNIADYVRMALRTTATRAALYGMSAKIRQLGYDTVIVSSYGMCSETCLPWQGRPYIDDVFSLWDGEIQGRSNGELCGKSHYCDKWFPLLSTALHGGLFHPNCRHTIRMWRDGDSIPEPQDNSEIQRRYRLEQHQRQLENKVRRAKRFVEGQSDPANVKKAKKLLRDAQKELREFIANTNLSEGATILKRDYGKEKIYTVSVNPPLTQNNSDNISHEYIDKYSESDIIESKENNRLSIEVPATVPDTVTEKVNSAVNKVAEDFPIINEQVSSIKYGYLYDAYGQCDFNTGTSMNKITLSESAFSNESDLLEKLRYDAEIGKSYATDNIASLAAHELGHALHSILALKRTGLEYGKRMTWAEALQFSNERIKIIQEIYLSYFADERYEEIIGECKKQLGEMAENPNELIAQAFGNYYYGLKIQPLANTIVKYFQKELK